MMKLQKTTKQVMQTAATNASAKSFMVFERFPLYSKPELFVPLSCYL
jgi:hypothetical protein